MPQQDTETATISVLNQKGGAGKTTTTIHTAGALADRGHDVLVIDSDPAGSATKALGFKSYYKDEDQEFTLFEVLCNPDANDHLDRLIKTHEEFDIVPAHSRMKEKDISTHLQNGGRSEERLRFALASLDKSYDFILLDCAPEENTLTNNNLFVDGLLVPTKAEEMDVEGLDNLNAQVGRVMDYYPDFEVEVLGIVANRIEEDGENERLLETLNKQFPEIPVFEMRDRVALQRATSQSRSSIYNHPEPIDWSPGNSYDDIADHLEKQFLGDEVAQSDGQQEPVSGDD